MGRSPGFGLAHGDLRPIKARSPCGSAASAAYPATMRSSPDRSTKSTRSHFVRASTVCGHGVSGSLSLPSRGPFHLSLTVLSSIGHFGCLALGGGPPCFLQGSTCLVVLWYHLGNFSLRVRVFHPLRTAFPKPFCLKKFLDRWPATP